MSYSTCYPQNLLPEHKDKLPLVQGAPELQDVSHIWQVLQQNYDTNMKQNAEFEQVPFALQENAKTEQASSQGTLVSTNHRK